MNQTSASALRIQRRLRRTRQARAYGLYIGRIGRRPASMDDDYAAKVSSGHVHVAVEAGNLVGLAVLLINDDYLLVENIAVDPARQKSGIGRTLMAHAETVARRYHLTGVRLYTNAAMTENLKLYARLGYREVDRRFEHGFERAFFSKLVLDTGTPS